MERVAALISLELLNSKMLYVSTGALDRATDSSLDLANTPTDTHNKAVLVLVELTSDIRAISPCELLRECVPCCRLPQESRRLW